LARVDLPGNVQIAVASAYLVPSQKLGPTNLDILEKVGQGLYRANLPFIVGGDFNFEAKTLYSTTWLEDVGGQLVADSTLGTCRSAADTSTSIDWLVVSTRLAKLVAKVGADSDIEPHPHRPVAMTFHTLGKDACYVALERPERIPHERPIGPSREPLDWTEEVAMHRELYDMLPNPPAKFTRLVYSRWAEKADRELAQTVDHELRKARPHQGARLVLRKVFPSTELKTESSETRSWRWLFGRASEMRALRGQADKDKGRNIIKSLLATSRATCRLGLRGRSLNLLVGSAG